MAVFVWLILAGLLFIVELCSMEFIMLWFGFGALLSSLLAFLNVKIIFQLLTFVVVGFLLCIFLRKIAVLRHINIRTNRLKKKYLGKTGEILHGICNNKFYIAKFGAKKHIVSLDKECILNKGTKVSVTGVSNGVMICSKNIGSKENEQQN